MRRLFLILPLFLLAAAGCNTLPQSINAAGHAQHIVICWLKPGGDAAAVIRSADELSKIDGVLDVAIGHKLASDRPVVDSSFDLAMVVTFRDEAALRRYDSDPIHQRIVAEVVKPNVERYIAYDALLAGYAMNEQVTESTLRRREKALQEQEAIINRRTR